MTTPVIIVDTFDPRSLNPPVPGATPPSVTLIQPYQDPPNTFRAQTVQDMYTLSMTPSDFNMVYEVGVPASIPPRYITISNILLSNDLQVDLSLPPYITTDIVSSFVINAGTFISFTASFDEDAARSQSLAAVGDFTQNIGVTIYPLNVTGPVYVNIALPPAPPVTPPPAPPVLPPVPEPQTDFGSGGEINTVFGGNRPAIGGIGSNPNIHPYPL